MIWLLTCLLDRQFFFYFSKSSYGTPSKHEVDGKNKSCKDSVKTINIYYCLIASQACNVWRWSLLSWNRNKTPHIKCLWVMTVLCYCSISQAVYTRSVRSGWPGQLYLHADWAARPSILGSSISGLSTWQNDSRAVFRSGIQQKL